MKRSYTILYAEDDHEDLKIISEAFEKYTEHLKVEHACNGKEALQLLDRMCDNASAPCLIILDINMPTMDGIETLLQIRKVKEYRQIPVVLFSTSSNHLEKRTAESMGAHLITKPARYFEMQKLVEQFVSMCLIEEKVK